MSTPNSTVPYGFCHCGCGQRTPLATKTNAAERRVKGQPCRFVTGHYKRAERTTAPPNPSGLCGCGCGLHTPLASKTSSAAGWIKGQPTRYVMGHQSHKSSVDYVIDETSGCWVWQRSLSRGGYGSVRAAGKTCRAHRVYYEAAKGTIPDGMDIDHLCRNRACVNPEHLEAVTTAENVHRGRLAKLTADDVRLIRASHETGRALAERFNVTESAISGVRVGRSWKSVV